MKKISVIVPCYNAEGYIRSCLDSLINQSIGMDSMELILVNDASTDSTLHILNQYEAMFPDSIIVVNCEENGKQGKARNIGLMYANAKYVGFADNDDVLELTMFEKLLAKAEKYNCDLVCCYSKKHSMEELKSVPMGSTKVCDEYIEIASINDREKFINRDINVAIWNKIYKKEIILRYHIEFPSGYIYDDICFSELIKHYVNRIYILEEYLYHHIVRAEGASFTSKDILNKLGYFDVQVIKIEELMKRGIYKDFKEHYREAFFIDYITLISNLIKSYMTLDIKVLNCMKDSILQLFPDYNEIPLVKRILSGNFGEFYKTVCRGLECKIDENYVNKLIETYKCKSLNGKV